MKTSLKKVLTVAVVALIVLAAAAQPFSAYAKTNAESTSIATINVAANSTPGGVINAYSSASRGDVNGDGSVTASDALIVMWYTLQLIQLSDLQLSIADCDGNGEVDVHDALIIMRYCIGYAMPEPEEPIEITEPTIIVDDSIRASAGETVEVSVCIVNNPGVAGAILTLSYDSNLTLNDATLGDAFSVLQYTRPGQLSNPCNFSWDSESGMATDDGVIITLTFLVSNTVSSGDSLNINISYNHGDIYDEDLNDVDLDIINGCITIN